MASAQLKEVVSLYQSLTQEWNKKPTDFEKCQVILNKAKISLTTLNFLPVQDSAATKQELLVARDILEIGAQWALSVKDIHAFESYLSQLKCYYLDYKADLPESAYKYQLLGLNLLRLLAQYKLADFHTELELLTTKDLHQNVYIKHPVSIEQYLMEGSYNKIFLAKDNVPAENYNFFMDILLDTIRDEIASCIEKAYGRLSFSEATRMLFFTSQKQMKVYTSERNWQVKPDNFFYFIRDEHKDDEIIPAEKLATQTIDYAKELEMIV